MSAREYLEAMLPQEFPGLICDAMDCLPHPGEVFLSHFDSNNSVRIGLEAHWRNGLSFDLVIQLGDRILFKEKNIKIKLLPIDRDCIPDFTVRSAHVGKETDFILEKKARYFKERYLEQLRKTIFYLELGPPDLDMLCHSDQYVLYFWDQAEESGFKSGQPRRKIEVYLNYRGRDRANHPYLSYRQLYWDQLIDKKDPFLKGFENLLKWHQNWIEIQHLIIRGVRIDLSLTWKVCRREIVSSLNLL